ncbi:MAG TPA: hypothetical protein VGS80_01275 [Ktedonobacterales bacterium]|nr:hypothetical protein [Ktedonobacterales bacterium]
MTTRGGRTGKRRLRQAERRLGGALGSTPYPLGFIGAPTYPMLRDATARAFFDLLPRGAIRDYSKSEGHLRLVNGSEILFRSLDEPDHASGVNLAWFWLDEAPLAGYYAWQVLKGRLRQHGYATAGWATGTPHGRDGFWRDFEQRPRPSHALFRAATYANLHNLPPDYVAELSYSGAFLQQEVYGLFVAFEGLVYTFDPSPQGHVRAPDPAKVWSDVVGGVDWGYANPAVALVFGLDGDSRAWQLDEFYQRRASLDDILIPAVLDLTRRHGVRRWFCGPDEPEHIAALAAALAREHLPALALKADNAVRPGIQSITGLLALRDDGTRGLYLTPRCVHTIAEYASYHCATADSSHRDPSEQPAKQNDHALDATRYAVHTALGQTRAADAQIAALQRRLDLRNALRSGSQNSAVDRTE